MNTTLRRTMVVLATTLASLAFLATPVSASTHTATITGGTLSSSSTSQLQMTLGGAAGAGCTSSLSVTADHTSGTVNITTFTILAHFILGGTHYVASLTRTASATGSASGGVIGGGTLGDPTITFTMEIFPATGTASGSTSVDCTPRSARVCSMRVNNMALGGSYTAPTSDPTHGSMGSSSTYNISSTTGGNITSIVGVTCANPFNSYIGCSVTITNLTGHFTN